MVARNELEGSVFGMLTVTAEAGRDKKANILWSCRCICGGIAVARAYDLKAGKIISCGCAPKHGRRTHGQRRSKAYAVWAAMIQRCRNPKDKSYAHYGGRGVKVCDQWTDFSAFLRDMGHPPPRSSLEREDNDGPYHPANCRWASVEAQARNKRNNIWFLVNGRKLIMSDAAKKIGVSRNTLSAWRRKGLTDDEIEARALWRKLQRGGSSS